MCPCLVNKHYKVIYKAELTVQQDEMPQPPPPPKFGAGTDPLPEPDEQLKADITFFTLELPHLGHSVLCASG